MKNKVIGKPDLDTATRILAQQMMAQAQLAHQVLESYIAYQKAQRKEAEWVSGVFRAGLGLLLVFAGASLGLGVIERVLLCGFGGWLTMSGGLATSTEYNDTMKEHGPLLARFIAHGIGLFQHRRVQP